MASVGDSQLRQSDGMSNDLKTRCIGLDFARAAAISLVLGCHLVTTCYSLDNKIIWGWAIATATCGVEIFFALSGFLIGGILFRQTRDQGTFEWSDLLPWWQRRWWRTLPNYLLFLVIYLVTALCFRQDPVGWPKYLVFLQNAIPAWPSGGSFYAIAWSLAIEEWAYLGLPLFLVITRQLVPASYRSPERICLLAMIPLLVVPFLMRLTASSGYEWDGVVRKTTIFRIDSIVLGAVGAWIATFRPNLFGILSGIRCAWSAVFGWAILVAILIFKVRSHDATFSSINAWFMNGFFFSFLDISFVILIAFLSRVYKLPLIPHKLVTFLALISYSIYLSHPLVLRLASRWIVPHIGDSHVMRILAILCMLSASLVFSFVIYRYWECPMTAMREKSKSKHSPG